MDLFTSPWQLDCVTKAVKLRVPSAVDDALIAHYAEEIRRRILHYIHLADMPDALMSVWASMVVDLLIAHQAANPDVFGAGADGAGVEAKKISEGDTSIELGAVAVKTTANTGAGTAQALLDSIVNNYAIDLHRYRRMGW